VPYKTVPTAMNDVLAGRVSMILTDLTPGLPHVKAGTLRALAVTRLKRSALLPDVPPCTKPASPISTWIRGRHYSRRPTPRRRSSKRLNAELRAIIDSPEARRGWLASGSRNVELARRAQRLRQGAARQMDEDDQGRRIEAE